MRFISLATAIPQPCQLTKTPCRGDATTSKYPRKLCHALLIPECLQAAQAVGQHWLKLADSCVLDSRSQTSDAGLGRPGRRDWFSCSKKSPRTRLKCGGFLVERRGIFSLRFGSLRVTLWFSPEGDRPHPPSERSEGQLHRYESAQRQHNQQRYKHQAQMSDLLITGYQPIRDSSN